jgi:hypothetical protein
MEHATTHMSVFDDDEGFSKKGAKYARSSKA